MYTLQGTTLPNPKRFTRNIIEKGVEHLLMFGKTTKRVENRKEQFVLEYQYLTQPQINSILSLFELGTVLSFTIDEENLSVPETLVLMDVTGLEYPPSGELWREHMVITLTEVI